MTMPSSLLMTMWMMLPANLPTDYFELPPMPMPMAQLHVLLLLLLMEQHQLPVST
jgi:hypothetical protein